MYSATCIASSLYFKLWWKTLTVLHTFYSFYKSQSLYFFFVPIPTVLWFLFFFSCAQESRPLPLLMTSFHADTQNVPKIFSKWLVSAYFNLIILSNAMPSLLSFIFCGNFKFRKIRKGGMGFIVNLLTDRVWPHLCHQSFESLILLPCLVSSTIIIGFFYMEIL